ncbi:MAG TPA: hypothetical protein VHO84_14445 [Syntrophorhabdaceae bacterium]|nr:hypothetical protein [Syntrophorhabdaceae bacterium]
MSNRGYSLLFNLFSFLAIVSIFLCFPPALRAGEDKETAPKIRQQEQNPSGNFSTSRKETVPLQAGYIRLKPKNVYYGENDDQTVFDIDFGENRSLQKSKEDEKSGPLLRLEKIDDIDTKNSLIRKEVTSNYRTEVSMGLRVSPFSEVYLGKGFLVPRKDEFAIDPRDNGWRLKFKFNF